MDVRLSEGSTVSGSVLSGDSDLLCSFGLDVSLVLLCRHTRMTRA